MGKGKQATAEMRAYREDKKEAADVPLKSKKNKRLEEKREGPSSPENQKESEREAPRVVSRPEDVAGLVFMQIDQVNARKDELTIAIKGLSDLTRQLVKAYGEHTNAIQRLQQRVRDMENEKK
jgi:hypothetical protein